MNWMDLLSECWELLNIELKKEKIEIESFTNYIFKYIFSI